MKILLASDGYKYQTSGVANVVIALAEEYRRKGHDVRVLAMSDTRHSFQEGDDCFFGSLPALVYPDIRFSYVLTNRILRELREWKPDIVHLHTEGSAARLARSVARAAGHPPVVMTAHTDYAQFAFGKACDSRPVQKIAHVVGRIAYRDAKVVTAPSDKALSFHHLNAVRDRMVVIPNGIRLEQYQKQATPEERTQLYQTLGLKENGKTLVAVSRISREKNLAEILSFFPAVLERVPEAQLLIVGEGPAREKLMEDTKEMGLTDCVRFTGRIPPEEVYRYYNLGDVFVSASTFEVHSLTYLEAMARGLPLVCRDDPCLHGVLETGDNGFAYQTKEEYLDAVTSLLTDGDLRRRMSARALEKSAEFSVERCAERMIELYRDVLDGKEFRSA